MSSESNSVIGVDAIEAGRMIGVSARTVERLRASKQLRSFTVCRLRRYLVADIEQFVARRLESEAAQ